MEPMKPMKPMEPMEPMEPLKAGKPWWPSDLGSPDSSGSQDDARYAYFGHAHRLVVERHGKTTTYDTGSHRIQGIGQQGGGSAPTFSSDRGEVRLDALDVVR